MALRRLRPRLSLELRVLESVDAFNQLDLPAYGYAVAKELASAGSRILVSHGALYRALDRSIERGLLEADWEMNPFDLEWPRRRTYRVTPAGSVVLAEGSMRSVAVQTRAWIAPQA